MRTVPSMKVLAGDGDAGRHVAAEDPISHRRDRPREPGPVVDTHRLVAVVDADDVHRL